MRDAEGRAAIGDAFRRTYAVPDRTAPRLRADLAHCLSRLDAID